MGGGSPKLSHFPLPAYRANGHHPPCKSNDSSGSYTNTDGQTEDRLQNIIYLCVNFMRFKIYTLVTFGSLLPARHMIRSPLLRK